MIDLQLLAQIRDIRLTARRLIESQQAGRFTSLFGGRGLELREVREYQPGDDVRTIDWNVTARTNHPHIKVYHPERQHLATILLDCSGSVMRYWNNPALAELCAVLGTLAIANEAKVGLICHSDKVERAVDPAVGESQVARIINEVLSLQPQSQRTNLSGMLKSGFKHVSKHSALFLISDLHSELDTRILRQLAENYDTVIIRLALSVDWAKLGIQYVADSETNETLWVDFAAQAATTATQSENERVLNQLETWRREFGIQSCEVVLQDSPTESLVASLAGLFSRP